jgi:succinate dehydrogenase hydrophobic anchor subunit
MKNNKILKIILLSGVMATSAMAAADSDITAAINVFVYGSITAGTTHTTIIVWARAFIAIYGLWVLIEDYLMKEDRNTKDLIKGGAFLALASSGIFNKVISLITTTINGL